ncbi:flagellar motor switch protein FliN [Thermotoga profunda]|uniref:flagellar motor switch protein FliN n=1 Tax=Thermotoga profunda TaxID=1508420 RepID=UPI000597134E|nr:flagellar motor switch protein FliN [Thermotoga profunda]
MNSDFLTQDELNELLKGLSEDLNDEDKKIITEISDMIMNSSTVALGIVIGREVKISLKEISSRALKDLLDSMEEDMVSAEVEFADGIKGDILFLFPQSLGARIADMMMGGSGEPESFELDEVRISAITETMNQMMGAATTSLSEKTKKKISIANMKVNLLKKGSQASLVFNPVQILVCVTYNLDLENGKSSTMAILSPILFFKDIYNVIHPQKSEPTKAKKEETKVKVQPVQFQEFAKQEGTTVTPPSEFSGKLELLLDVPLKVVVELGRAKMTLKQILEMNIGSLIELDKLTGEPVDILVNGRLIARGEVVVVDENFGVRITEIVSPKQRIYSIRETNGV